MGRQYSIERSGGITTIRLRRRLALAEMLEVIDEVAGEDDCPRRLWDVTSSFDYRPDEIQAIAERGRVHWPGAARVAYLAADDLSFGLLRMFEVYREQERYETRVFRDESEAREWLARWAPPEEAATATAGDPPQGKAPADRIANGESGWWRSADGVARRRQIEAEVRARYEADLQLAGWFKEAWLERRIRREIAAECAKVTPEEALWAPKPRPQDEPD